MADPVWPTAENGAEDQGFPAGIAQPGPKRSEEVTRRPRSSAGWNLYWAGTELRYASSVMLRAAGLGSAVARLPGERRTSQGLAEEGSASLEEGPSTTRHVNLRCLDGCADPGCPDTQATRGGSANEILLGAAARYSGR
ncbi:hypothetical protein NDU88_006224 [Pleurodeles waltl]|uniref:Uncharacterized protein n=1 Tax=Pleurodeles waltl TaxID=8319 RepID=A0AAV7ULT5_PLEWA|nr:hypothetical protein NDU88_006224 [Pleurodeles waltl]